MPERGLNILDALENLNILVDADSLDEIEVTGDAHLIGHKGEVEGGPEEIYWVKAGADTQTLETIKETFRTVYEYLVNFYSKMKQGGDTKKLVEGINTIMVLVGEAAKRLDRFGTVFKHQVTEFSEYQELQNFYRNRVIKESFKEFAKIPIPNQAPQQEGVIPELEAAEEELQHLLAEDEVEEIAGVHILNDLEVIKRDHLYELFYLKNEAGYNFYSYELARTIKLACDFGEFSEEYFGEDPLLQIKNWEDKSLHLLSQKLLKKSSRLIEKFFKQSMKYKDMGMIASTQKALMALMLAANPRNLIRQFSLKGSHHYFHDFLLFLRETLTNREYQKFLIYSAPAGQPYFQDVLDLVHKLCYHLYTLTSENEEMQASLKQIIERSKHEKSASLSKTLTQAYEALSNALKHHPNGPVFKAVDIIREEDQHRIFDPLLQGNLPQREWCLVSEGHQINALRMACPTMQDVINKAYVTEEFKTFLKNFGTNEHLFFINFQDRTSWKEHARSVAIEELSRQAEFAHTFTVVTLAKDTEFYNQAGIYADQDDAGQFVDHFNQHLQDEITGYYFPSKLKEQLFPTFTSELLAQIHDTFFDEKKHLSFKERLDFILLAYHFLELKLLELVNSSFVTLSSKDGLDIGASSTVGLIALLTVNKGKKWEEKELDRLNTILFGPTLLNRERVIHPERFERLVSMIRLLEKNKENLKPFAHLFKKETLSWEVQLF